MRPSTDSLSPIAEGIFRKGQPPVLLGGRNRGTGAFAFPMPQGFGSENYDPCDLGSRGTLFTWTIQRFRPKSPPYAGPESFEPFALGYVNIDRKVIVEARLTNVAFTDIHCGMAMRLVLEPFEKDGSTVANFAFEPEKQL